MPSLSSRPEKGEPTRKELAPEVKLELYKTAYAEGKSALEKQFAELDGFRQRAVQFEAFVGSATAFLVGTSGSALSAQFASTGHLDRFYLLAICASLSGLISVFALVLLLTNRVWSGRNRAGNRSFPWPRKVQWDKGPSARLLVERWVDPEIGGASPDAYFRRLALDYDKYRVANRPFVQRLKTTYTVVLGSGVLSILGWSSLLWVPR